MPKSSSSISARSVRAEFSGIPSFFRACCREASYGGVLGYDHAGHELHRHIRSLAPYSIEDDDWQDNECDALDRLIEADDRDGVIAWFVGHYPRCMALIPCRRRETFLRGVFAMAAERGIEPTAEQEGGAQ